MDSAGKVIGQLALAGGGAVAGSALTSAFSGSAAAGAITIGSGAAATTLTGSAALIVATGGAAGLVIAGVGAGCGLYAWMSRWPVPGDGGRRRERSGGRGLACH